MNILWCGVSTPLRRVVVRHDLSAVPRIVELAERMCVPVLHVHEQTPDALAGDLWVGVSPSRGWTPDVGRIMWARSAEAPVVVAKLEEALQPTVRAVV